MDNSGKLIRDKQARRCGQLGLGVHPRSLRALCLSNTPCFRALGDCIGARSASRTRGSKPIPLPRFQEGTVCSSEALLVYSWPSLICCSKMLHRSLFDRGALPVSLAHADATRTVENPYHPLICVCKHGGCAVCSGADAKVPFSNEFDLKTLDLFSEEVKSNPASPPSPPWIIAITLLVDTSCGTSYSAVRLPHGQQQR